MTDNPPAFPLAWEERNEHGFEFANVRDGMTLRDYFAGQALAGLCVNAVLYVPDASITADERTETADERRRIIAQRAYSMAYYMLEIRKIYEGVR